MKYSRQNKEHFFVTLERYKKARNLLGKNGVFGNSEFVAASVAIHAALGDVPKSYKKYVIHAERTAS